MVYVTLSGWVLFSFNLNYRLAVNKSTVFPAQENDIKAAVQNIIDQSSSYLISNKIVIMGVSAGAHLAFPGFGRVERVGKVYRYHAVTNTT